MRTRFNEVDGFIKIYDGIRYLVLCASKRYNKIYNRIRYLISKKSGITDISHNFARIRIDSFLEKSSYKDKSNTQYCQMNVCIL